MKQESPLIPVVPSVALAKRMEKNRQMLSFVKVYGSLWTHW